MYRQWLYIIRVGYIFGDITISHPKGFSKFAYLVDYLAQHDCGIEPVVLYTSGDTSIFNEGVRTERFSGFGLPNWHEAGNRRDIDVFHTPTIPQLGHAAAFRSKKPVVSTARGTAHWARNKEFGDLTMPPIYKWRWRIGDSLGRFNVDKIFAISQYVKNVLTSRAHLPEEKVEKTYVGIENEVFDLPVQNHPEGIPQRYILNISRPKAIKDPETLLRVHRKLNQQLEEEIHLVVAGIGWDKTSLVTNIGDEKYIKSFGFIEEKERIMSLYDHAKCLVTTSVHETFDRPNIEAMARSTPVVSSPNCALSEVVNGNGILVNNPHDVEGYVKEVTRIFEDDELRATLEKDGFEYAKQYKMRRYAERLRSQYDTVVR